MAGKLFPETYIGDSEGVCKKTPTGKKHLVLQRDAKSAGAPSAESKAQDDGTHLAEIKELPSEGEGYRRGDVEVANEEMAGPAAGSRPKEERAGNQKYPKPPPMNWLDIKPGQEKTEGTQHPTSAGRGPEEMNSQETLTKNPAHNAQEGLWPLPGDNTKEHQECQGKEVSVMDGFESNGKQTVSASVFSLQSPMKIPLDHEGYFLCDEEAFLKESTGYFPCYRTYVELPRYQAPTTDGHQENKGACRDAGVQCNGCPPQVIEEKKGVETNNNSKETKVVLHDLSPRGQPRGGSRPRSGGRRLEGSSRHSRPHGDGSPEAGGNMKETAASPKPRTPGSSKEAPGPGPRTGTPLPPPTASVSRKSLQKRKHHSSPTDEKDSAKSMELKPLLPNHHSLSPTPEQKAKPLPVCCYSTEGAGESREAMPRKENESSQWVPSIQSSLPSSELPGTPPELHATSSWLSFHALVSWVRRIFRKPAQPQPRPSTSNGTATIRMSLGRRLRLWFAQQSGRVHPGPS